MKYFLLCFFSCCLLSGYAQIYVGNVSEFEKLKNGTLYIAMKDTASPKAAPYIAVYRDVWKFSKIAFIKQEDMPALYAEGNYFLSVGSSSYGGNYNTKNEYGGSYAQLELWRPASKFFSGKKDRQPRSYEREVLATVDLYGKKEETKNAKLLLEYDYDLNGAVHNWSPGLVKNYIQEIQRQIESGKPLKRGTTVRNSASLAQLPNATLLVPDYTLLRFNMASGDQSKSIEKEELMAGYGWKYNMVNAKELSDKILNDKKGFFYLLYVHGTSGKYVSIVHSLSGEIIYTETASMSYNIKPGDLKDIRKAVEKGD